jgi:integrase
MQEAPIAGFTTPETTGQMKRLVLDSVDSVESKRLYGRAVDRFFEWFQKEKPSSGFGRAAVQSYKAHLIALGLASSTINAYLIPIRRMAIEAAANNLMASELASGIKTVKGVRRHGVRLGSWLTAPQTEALIGAPDTRRLSGKRDRALLAILIGCGLRREETAFLRVEDIQLREGRWVAVDLIGKGKRVRSIPVPSWAKEAADEWTQAAGFHSGRLFRAINKGDRICHDSMTAQSIFEAVKKYVGKIGMESLAPHDLRRTFAKLAHKGNAPIHQIQLSLGHSSCETTERYLGIEQDLADAPCDRLGLRLSNARGQIQPSS